MYRCVDVYMCLYVLALCRNEGDGPKHSELQRQGLPVTNQGFPIGSVAAENLLMRSLALHSVPNRLLGHVFVYESQNPLSRACTSARGDSFPLAGDKD